MAIGRLQTYFLLHLLVFMMFIINGRFMGCGKYCCAKLEMQDIAAYIFLDI